MKRPHKYENGGRGTKAVGMTTTIGRGQRNRYSLKVSKLLICRKVIVFAHVSYPVLRDDNYRVQFRVCCIIKSIKSPVFGSIGKRKELIKSRSLIRLWPMLYS